MPIETGEVGRIPVFEQYDRASKALRTSGRSSAALAEYLGVAKETVSRYANGKAPIPLQTLRLWALFTGVPFKWLETGETPSPNGDGASDVRPKGFEPLTS